MILYLGVSDAPGDFQPINIPDEYPITDVTALLPSLRWGPGRPAWVASDSPTLAAAAADHFGGIPVRPVPATAGVA